ncbi:hypothetical protein MPTK1_1g15900 [Marchantia polymorpha subsp. ruderalis]|uniref:Uncharacterized protein n=2 Tax=Marchantia polymorpha TaxID=3197 RepID=A0AAF6AQM5_MARPO|nr:hypothetical protein MARPO_0033s0070 [Marchantia polymorpha]BBM98745.1 hypothetical protein Mp_1g15900 [Marchantia polymorpha subsp. ruderalis]|eukprot:PTQ41660.1 hypothetical protein MARPO_0033s0070 [Marchantia polymorpha]
MGNGQEIRPVARGPRTGPGPGRSGRARSYAKRKRWAMRGAGRNRGGRSARPGSRPDDVVALHSALGPPLSLVRFFSCPAARGRALREEGVTERQFSGSVDRQSSIGGQRR